MQVEIQWRHRLSLRAKHLDILRGGLQPKLASSVAISRVSDMTGRRWAALYGICKRCQMIAQAGVGQLFCGGDGRISPRTRGTLGIQYCDFVLACLGRPDSTANDLKQGRRAFKTAQRGGGEWLVMRGQRHLPSLLLAPAPSAAAASVPADQRHLPPLVFLPSTMCANHNPKACFPNI